MFWNHWSFTLLQNYKVIKLLVTRLRVSFPFYTLTKLQGSQTPFSISKILNRVLHSYKITRFSNVAECKKVGGKVLHSYKITRFSNPVHITAYRDMFYTLTKLQGSQTISATDTTDSSFYTLTKLQGSQTRRTEQGRRYKFYTLTKLQGSQTPQAFISSML